MYIFFVEGVNVLGFFDGVIVIDVIIGYVQG